MTKCGLCGQEFDDDDQRIEERKEKHEIYHLTRMGNQRHSGNVKIRNAHIGKVVWQ